MAGKLLRRWLEEKFDGLADVEPLAAKLCRLEDLLHATQDEIECASVTKKNALITTELKIHAQYLKVWVRLGLSDKPDEMRRPVGRPPEAERIRRWPA
jgi:hypothetical protein